jgi:hypothetical protein
VAQGHTGAWLPGGIEGRAQTTGVRISFAL